MNWIIKTVIWVVSIILLLVVGGMILLNFYFLPHLKEKIIAKVNDSSEGIYHCTIDSLDADIFSGNVFLGNVHLYTDKVRHKSSKDSVPLMSLKVKEISAKNIRWLSYLFSKHLSLSELQLVNPIMSYEESKKKEKDHKTIAENLPARLASFCKSLRVGKFAVNNWKLNFSEGSEQGITRHEIKKIDFKLEGIHIASSSKKPLFADQLSFTIEEYKIQFPLYSSSLYIHSLHGSSKEKLLYLKSVSLQSKPKHVSHDIPQYEISMKSVKANHVNFRKLLHLKEVEIEKCILEQVNVDIYENSNRPPLREKKLFPYEIFHEIIPVSFNLDTLSIVNSNFIYRGILPETQEPIKVSFTGSNIQMAHIFNEKRSGKNTRIHGRSHLFGSVPVNVSLDISLNDPNINFHYHGSVGEMKLELLNPIITKAAPAAIKDGILHSGSFDFKVKKGIAKGTVSADYENLKIELHSNITGRKLHLLNIIGNQRIINKSKDTVTEEIEYAHQETESFFLFLLRPIISGAVKIVLKGEENKKAIEKITHPKHK